MHHAEIIWLLLLSPAIAILVSRHVRINLSKEFVPGYAAHVQPGLFRAKAVLEMFAAAGSAAAMAARPANSEDVKVGSGVTAP